MGRRAGSADLPLHGGRVSFPMRAACCDEMRWRGAVVKAAQLAPIPCIAQTTGGALPSATSPPWHIDHSALAKPSIGSASRVGAMCLMNVSRAAAAICSLSSTLPACSAGRSAQVVRASTGPPAPERDAEEAAAISFSRARRAEPRGNRRGRCARGASRRDSDAR
jgi:hypothetical protein